MMRYDPYTDSFIDNPTKETTATININALPKNIIQMNVVEVSDASIEKIADAVVRKLTDRKTEPIDRDDLGNCNICKYVGLEHRCNQCVNGSMFCKDEPQTMVYPQVDGITPSVIEPQTERSE